MRSPITAKGALRLRAELDELKSVKRPKVIAEIEDAVRLLLDEGQTR